MADELKSVSLKNLVKTKKITGIGTLNINKNGYPFVTVLQNNKAQSLYFGQKTGVKVLDNFEKGQDIINFLKDCVVVQTITQEEGHEGELRFKLSSSQGTKYTSGASLLSVFDVEDEVDFDMESFDKAFSSKSESVVQATPQEA